MTPLGWGAIGVLGLGLVIVLAQLTDLRRRISSIPMGDDDLLGVVRQVDNGLASLEAGVAGIEDRVTALEGVVPSAMRRSAVVKFDAYPGMVGSLSRSVAMLDDRGNGFVVSVLVDRDDSRFFLKSVKDGQGVEPLSPEETAAISEALRR